MPGTRDFASIGEAAGDFAAWMASNGRPAAYVDHMMGAFYAGAHAATEVIDRHAPLGEEAVEAAYRAMKRDIRAEVLGEGR